MRKLRRMGYEEMTDEELRRELEEIQQELEAERADSIAHGARLIETCRAQILVTEDNYHDLEAMQILKETAVVSAEVGLEDAGYIATSQVQVQYDPHAFGGQLMEFEEADGTKKTKRIVGYFRATIKGYKP